ncbi:MAG: ABC-2 family transporter protein [Oscillospiraceae bacterium]|nr:ABC-2 family transporter protein [Oscillospiraceae bacterium]
MKTDLKSYIKIYFMLITQDFKSKMQYRADFLISLAAMLATNFTGLISFWLIFRTIPAIKGFSYNEILFIYGFSLLASVPMQLFFDNLWQLGDYCMNGNFLRYCFKPVNIFFYYVSETFDAKGLGQLAFGLIMFIYAWIRTGIPVTAGNIAVLLLMMFGASMSLIGLMIMSSAFSFVSLYGNSMMSFMIRFRDYSRYPVSIFNPVFKFLFTFIIPMGFLAFYPSLYFLRPGDHNLMSLLTPIAGIIIFYLGYKLWIWLAVRYAGTGT